jgi:hypothetical protein
MDASPEGAQEHGANTTGKARFDEEILSLLKG